MIIKKNMVLKICCGTWENESRDKRELSAYRELGEKVLVLAKGKTEGKGYIDEVDGFEVRRHTTRPMERIMPKHINRVISLFMWSNYTKNVLKPDVISGHDLQGVLIGWLSNQGRLNKAKLIYDSHEFEIGRNKKRNKIQLWWVTHLERYLIKKCAFSIVVNDSIANEVQRIHKIKQRPIVVRSTPEKWKIDYSVCAQRRAEFFSQLNSDCNFLLMFHGNLGDGNGIEGLIHIVAKSPKIGLVLMGNQTSPSLTEKINKTIEEYHIEGQILFKPPVDIKDLWQYVGAVDVEMMIIEPIVASHYLVLPNKFFESIQALTPIIASDLPEMKQIIDKYQIGLTCHPNDIDEAYCCVERMQMDRDFYKQCKDNLKIAKEELCWEKEKNALIDAYNKYIVGNTKK